MNTVWARQKWIWLSASLGVLLIGHVLVLVLPAQSLGWLAALSSTRTPPSILVRLFSIPVRIIGCAWLLIYLHKQTTPLLVTGSLWHQISMLWSLLCIYYIVDLLLHTLHTPALFTLFTTGGLLLVFCWGVYSPARTGTAVWVGLAALSISIWAAALKDGDNNAFTLFGLQGIALAVGSIKPSFKDRLGWFLVFCPALGYLFAVSEKLLLNPAGWLSGISLHRYSEVMQHPIPHWASLLASIGLIAFQLSMGKALHKPAWIVPLYVVAIAFHLVSGLWLGFSSALHPWISSLLFAIALHLGQKKVIIDGMAQNQTNNAAKI